jgi:hypothetical protein
VPTLVVLGRQDRRPWTDEVIDRRGCRNPEWYAGRVEFACVDDAAHFITDDPADGRPRDRMVRTISLTWGSLVGLPPTASEHPYAMAHQLPKSASARV